MVYKSKLLRACMVCHWITGLPYTLTHTWTHTHVHTHAHPYSADDDGSLQQVKLCSSQYSNCCRYI